MLLTGGFCFRKSINYKVPPNYEVEDPEACQKEEQERIDSSEVLSEEQLQEKEGLLQEGFAEWSRKDFNHFVRACAEYGRDGIDNICTEVEGKDPNEVRSYAKVFWQRKDELQDHDRIMSIIEKGEQKIQRKKDIRRALSAKMARYRSPFHQLHIVYGTNKGKNYTEEEDRFLVLRSSSDPYFFHLLCLCRFACCTSWALTRTMCTMRYARPSAMPRSSGLTGSSNLALPWSCSDGATRSSP